MLREQGIILAWALKQMRIRQRQESANVDWHCYLNDVSDFKNFQLIEIQNFLLSRLPTHDNYLRTRRWAEVVFSPLFVCLSVCLSMSRISQTVMDGFGRNLVDELGR